MKDLKPALNCVNLFSSGAIYLMVVPKYLSYMMMHLMKSSTEFFSIKLFDPPFRKYLMIAKTSKNFSASVQNALI